VAVDDVSETDTYKCSHHQPSGYLVDTLLSRWLFDSF
jgi:hypothetical protein